MKIKRIASLMAALAISMTAALITPPSAFAEETFYLGSAVNAGKDTGYSEKNAIEESDPHFGWELGKFSVSGYTAYQREDGSVTFLKTAGDKVKLSFELNQDIDALNGNSALTIANDEKGYDERLGVEKSEDGFGRGALIIRKVDYQNKTSKPQVYTNYLSGVKAKANTKVKLFEEGDYEVVLDYEIKNDKRKAGGFLFVPQVSVLPEYTSYTIRFKFKVRNGNTMAFMFDAQTGSELTNEATAPNGFKIDLAQSHYLNINVKREVLSGGKLDVRSNAPAEDGAEFTKEGVYTVTATNPTTEQTTEKIIYVGDDPELKAYAVTGYSLKQIRNMVKQGAEIADDGTIAWPTSSKEDSATDNETKDASAEAAAEGQTDLTLAFAIGILAVIVACAVVAKKLRDNTIARETVQVGTGKDGLPKSGDRDLPEGGDEE